MALAPMRAWAYDFSATCSTGQTLYYNITDNNNHYVEVTSPYFHSWFGFTKPTGSLTVPTTVTYNSTTYYVKAISDYAFSECTGLTSVNFESTSLLVSIGMAAFNGCSGLTSIYLGYCSSLSTIGNSAFSGCSEMTTVVFPVGLTSIGTQAFRDCSALTQISLPYGLTTIGQEAFWNCSNLNTLTIQPNVTSIGMMAFDGCTHLTTVRFLDSKLEKWCMIDFGSITSNPLHYGATLYLYENGGYTPVTELTIMNTGSPTAIKNYAFDSYNQLQTAIITSAVTNIGISAFSQCSNLTTVTLYGSGLTSIGMNAFNGCSSLTEIFIPSSVTSIGADAFSQCTGLTKVSTHTLDSWFNIDFGDNQANPLYYAGDLYVGTTNPQKLTALTIPSSRTTIKSYTFSGCTSLQTVTIPSSVTTIQTDAFSNCTNLTRVNTANENSWMQIDFATAGSNPLTNAHHLYVNGTKLTSLVTLGITTIKQYAFSGCTDLTELTFHSTVTSIGNGAFWGCTNLTQVNIGSNTVTSADYTISNNLRTRFGSQVTKYILSSTVTAVGANAFNGCTDMTQLTILNTGATTYGSDAFSGCTGLNKLIMADPLALCSSTFANANANPLAQARHLYSNASPNVEITALTIPSSVQAIGNYAFYGGSSITSLTIGNAVTSIGNYAFYGGSSLTLVTIGNAVTSIGKQAFQNCAGLTSITIPSSVQSIGNYAFDGCTSLTSVTINSNAVASADYTPTYDNLETRFGNQVTSYTLGSSVTAVGANAFNGCTGMTQLTILNTGATTYGSNAFSGCTGLNKLVMADPLALCSSTFANVNANPLTNANHLYTNTSPNVEITALTIPSSVQTIGNYAFYGGSSLTSVTIGNAVTSIGKQAFRNCAGLTSITIPSSVQSIGNYAFDGCTSLTSVTINSNAVASADYTPTYDNLETRFGNQVTSYTIGSEVTAIGANAFYGCTGITELHVDAMTPPTIYANTFSNVSRSIPVYVPIGTSASYRAAEYWSLFTNFVETVFPEQWVEVPYLQTFDGSTIPDKWRSCNGALQGENPPYTATLTPESGRWHFGAANGVFNGSSHAYVNIGGYQHYFWLVSPFLHLDANANMLSVDLAITRPSGNMVPMTPDAQDNTIIKVLISADYGATWTSLQSWKHEMGYTDLESLTPAGTTRSYNLSAYANQDILIGFYMECTDPDDAANRIHIDNFNVRSFNPTQPPTAVTVSEIAGHSAKVSWTPALSVQYKWDVVVSRWVTPQNGWTQSQMEEMAQNSNEFFYAHVNGYNYKTMTDLDANQQYTAFVRYNDGSVTSEWVATNNFTTLSMCNPPTNIQVETTTNTIFVSWEPGQANQTSWTVYIGGSDYWEYPTDNTEILIDAQYMLEPGEEFNVQIEGFCSDGDGDILSEFIYAQMQPLPSLTLNEGYSQDNGIVPITSQSLEDKASRTQFIIPAEMLTDMQYSTIQKIAFYDDYWRNGAPWGSNIWFKVCMMEVPESNYNDAEYPEDQFYGYWNDENFHVFNHGTLYIDNEGKVTITANSPFHYGAGNLLIGVWQDHSNYDPAGTNYHADWLGVTTQDWSSMYVPAGSDPMTAKFLPKVTFTYGPDAYLPPTNIVVTPIAPTEVTLTWTPREGQTATDVQLFNEDMVAMGTPWTWSNGNVFGLGNLDPGTDYYVSLRGRFTVGSETHYSAWTNPVPFSTPDYCDAPENLQVNEVGPFSATITWDNTAAYDEVEYRALEIQWEEGFEGLSGDALPSGWTKFYNGNGQASGGWWNYGSHNNIPPHSGERQMRSSGFSTYLSDNWLILPQMELGGVLKLWACTTQGTQQSFSVYVSTTGTNIADFGTTPVMTGSPLSYQEFIIDLSGFEGLGYVAIRHQDVPSGCTLVIDDVTYLNGGDWTSLGPVEGGQYDFEGLTPGTTYQARVRSMCDDDYYGYWSDPVSFSTPGNIVFQDQYAKGACLYAWDQNGDGNNDGELSYAEAAAVTDLGTVFKDQRLMTKFNELQYFTNPDLDTISTKAFAGCVSLQEITLPPQITTIGNYAFGYSTDNQGQIIPCSSLHSIVIPEGVTQIGDYAFCYSGLESIILPFSLTSIGQQAFEHCPLTSVYVPASVNSINNNPFVSESIETIEVDPMNATYDSRNACNAIIRKSDNKLISGCKNTVIPNGVVSIGRGAFEYATGLTSITLPSSVATIGESAFSNCTGLTSIIVESYTPPTIETNAFQNVNTANITVYVPCGSVATYQNNADWSGFNDIIGIDCGYTFTLVEGWNWWVPFIATSATDLEEALSEIEGDLLINSQKEGFLRRTDGLWNGTLTSIEPGQMYKILTTSGGSFYLSGAKPNTITVPLVEGYNWFGFLGVEPVTIQNALDTTPTDGDKIIRKIGDTYNTYTYNNGLWHTDDGGNIENFNLQPGHGFIYYSASGTKTLIMQQ